MNYISEIRQAYLEYEIPVLLRLEEGVAVGDRVADEEALAAAHVLLPHRRELGLARGVQDVEQAGLAVDDRALDVGVLDGGVVVVEEVPLDVLQGEGRLAHAAVAEDDEPVAPVRLPRVVLLVVARHGGFRSANLRVVSGFPVCR